MHFVSTSACSERLGVCSTGFAAATADWQQHCRDSEGFCCSCTLAEFLENTFTGATGDETRANLDCSLFSNPFFSGVAGSASCLRYDPLWYHVSSHRPDTSRYLEFASSYCPKHSPERLGGILVAGAGNKPRLWPTIIVLACLQALWLTGFERATAKGISNSNCTGMLAEG